MFGFQPDWQEQRRLVLIAEDDRDLRETLQSALEHEGFDVVTAPDAIQAVKYLDRSLVRPNDARRPDLLITDLRMPGLDGLDLLNFVGRVCRVPTILITAFSSEEVQEDARRLGATTTIGKPFDLDELCTTIRELLR